MDTNITPSYVLEYWYPTRGFQKFWFSGKYHDDVDNKITDKFTHLLNMYNNNALEKWTNTSYDSILALILLLDQITRNIFRNVKRDEKYDKHALELSKKYIQKMENDNYIPLIEHLVFVLMPFRHTKNQIDTEYVIIILEKYKENYKDDKLYNKFYRTSEKMLKVKTKN